MNSEFCVLIMAGGKGTRFWPKSTEEKPKQFISLIEDRTMLQVTIDRIRKILPIEKIFIATGEKYISLVKEQIPDLPNKNIIMEPVGRNTAPCILLSSLYIKQIYNNCNICVLPSDHLIKNEETFLNILKDADNFVNNNNESIVTIGINPDRPETGYGYIKYNKQENQKFEKVEKFVEKPDIEKAKQYVQSKEYLWNAGMFIFNVNYMLKELKNNYNSTYELFKKLPNIDDENYEKSLKEIYPQCEKISIDYAVMEKSQNMYVVPADFGWDDIGTWKSLERYINKDVNNNILKGNNIEYLNSSNCTVYGENKRVILIDVQDLFVIDGEDTIIVCKKDSVDKARNFRKE